MYLAWRCILLLTVLRPTPCSALSETQQSWAVIASTSKYWYNYRHTANALAVYRTVKRLGIPDSRIILMLPDDIACNARNAFPANVFAHPAHQTDLYGDSVEVDYSGYDVTVQNFIRVLTDRHQPNTPRQRRLLSSGTSNVLVYVSGHGGEDFLKFQGVETMMSHDLSNAVAQMHAKQRYGRLTIIIDTCQASSLFADIRSPNVITIASSQTGESSYSFWNDQDIGLTVIDRFTYFLLEALDKVQVNSTLTMQWLVNELRLQPVGSTVVVATHALHAPLRRIPVRQVFTTVRQPLWQRLPDVQLSAQAGNHPELALLGALALLAGCKVVTLEDAFSGFGSTSLATMLVATATASCLSQARGAVAAIQVVLGNPMNVPAAQVRLLLFVLLASALAGSTALVPLLVPLVTRWAAQHALPPGQLLLPLSYGAMLGGHITLVGNPSNLIVAGLLNERFHGSGRPSVRTLDVTYIGLPLAVWGVLCMVLFSPLLLPGYELGPTSPAGAGSMQDNDQFMLGLRVSTASSAAGKSIEQAALRNLSGVYLAAIRRGSHVMHAVGPQVQLVEGDVLYFTGQMQHVQDVAARYDLDFVSETLEQANVHGTLLGTPVPRPRGRWGQGHTPFAGAAAQGQQGVRPTVLPTNSSHTSPSTAAALQGDGTVLRMKLRRSAPIQGLAVRDVNFERRFNAVVLGISKAGRLLGWPLVDVRFEGGDKLLCSVGAEWWDSCARDVSDNFEAIRPVGRQQRSRLFSFALHHQRPNLSGLRVRDVLGKVAGASLTYLERSTGEHVHDALAANHVLLEGDKLWMCGTLEALLEAQQLSHVHVTHVSSVHRSVEQRLVQVVLSAQSKLLGKSVKLSRFRTEFGAAILSIYRGGKQLHGKLGDMVLQAGDTLLLDTAPSFLDRHRNDPRFALVVEVSDPQSSPRLQWRQAALPLLITLIALIVSALGIADMIVALSFALGLMLVLQLTTVEQITAGLRVEPVLTMGAALGISKVLEAGGFPSVVAGLLSMTTQHVGGSVSVIALLYLLTVLLSQAINSTAVVSFMFPVAVRLAEEQGIPLELLAIALMLAGGCTFNSPMLYQNNIIALGAGGYRVQDAMHFGCVLQVWQALGAITLLAWHQYWPLFWGLVGQASLLVLLGAPALAAYMGFNKQHAPPAKEHLQ